MEDYTKTKTALCLNFHTDPGHGWLETKRQDLEALQIQDQISGYSYQVRGKVYLEEDCDAGIYLAALKAAGIQYSIDRSFTDNMSFIRHLTPFKA